MELVERRYLASSLVGLLGVSHATLNNWVHAHHLDMLDAAKTPHKGTARLFTQFDVFRLIVMTEMTQSGLSPETAARLVKEACLTPDYLTFDRFNGWPNYSDSKLDRYLVVHHWMYGNGAEVGRARNFEASKIFVETDLRQPEIRSSKITIDLFSAVCRVQEAERLLFHNRVSMKG